MTGSRERNATLDFVRGSLVLVMVAYHGVSVGVGAGLLCGADAVITALTFVSHAFVFLAGGMCGWHYAPRWAASPGTVRRRLLVRAGKLLLLVAALNALRVLLLGADAWAAAREEAGSVLALVGRVLWTGEGELVSFEILYFIALVLLLFGLVGRLRAWAWAAAALALLPFSGPGAIPMRLFFGVAGVAAGIALGGTSATRWLERARPVALLAPIGIVAVQAWGRAGLASLGLGLPWQRLLMLFEILLWCGSAAGIAGLVCGSRPAGWVVSLGRNPLLGYIVQMFFIVAAWTLLARLGIGEWAGYAAGVAACAGFLVALVRGLEWARSRAAWVDRCYAAVFE
jgi:hypothetical protein